VNLAAGTLPAMTKRIAIASFLLCLLAACGNKGPLVMPEAKPAAQPAATPAEPAAAAEPATTESGTPAR
jgi:predicted small lipoprotein YifL